MKHLAIAGACGALAVSMIVGCSSQNAKTTGTTTTTGVPAAGSSPAAAAPETSVAAGTAHVTFGGNDAGPVTAVGCQTDSGVTTITLEASPKTTVVLTDENAPTVKSVSIGQAGSEGPSLVFLEGISATPQVTRDGNRFTVTGTGMGTDATNTDNPVEMPFEISVTCP